MLVAYVCFNYTELPKGLHKVFHKSENNTIIYKEEVVGVLVVEYDGKIIKYATDKCEAEYATFYSHFDWIDTMINTAMAIVTGKQIGRASCRERVLRLV